VGSGEIRNSQWGNKFSSINT